MATHSWWDVEEILDVNHHCCEGISSSRRAACDTHQRLITSGSFLLQYWASFLFQSSCLETFGCWVQLAKNSKLVQSALLVSSRLMVSSHGLVDSWTSYTRIITVIKREWLGAWTSCPPRHGWIDWRPQKGGPGLDQSTVTEADSSSGSTLAFLPLPSKPM